MSYLPTPVAWEDPGHSHTALDYGAYVQSILLGIHAGKLVFITFSALAVAPTITVLTVESAFI